MLVILTSARKVAEMTDVEIEEELFVVIGSGVRVVTVAMLMILLPAPATTFNVNFISRLSPTARESIAQVTCPVAPTAGVV